MLKLHEKQSMTQVWSHGNFSQNSKGNTGADCFDESGDNESDDGGCSGDYSAGDESEGHGSEGNKNLDENDDAVVGEEMVKINSLTAEGIREIEFASVDKAYDFYFKYGKCKCFAVRKSDIRRDVNDGIVMRQYVCNKQGFREKKHLSRLRVHYRPKKGRYVVFIFEEGHNHELTPSSVVHLHPVSRKISEVDKAQIDGLQSHGIRTCHIMGYLVAQKGGYPSVGFTKKYLYNCFDKKMHVVIKDGDVYAALNYLNVKSSTDPHSFGVYSSTDDGRLKCLFWEDGTSKSSYFCFGVVVAFDTTYKKKKIQISVGDFFWLQPPLTDCYIWCCIGDG
ncbi:FAR1 DNA-binding domain protein [Medicago truncatula]|uniref:FAR1 DNA-binding domain protein n=1 Tax=Medicago truncatula TaxID=3880 RepID=A0A072TZ24_MEDTR|nr:FAR1 DNA-binding domain protein [Medicago truncatula]